MWPAVSTVFLLLASMEMTAATPLTLKQLWEVLSRGYSTTPPSIKTNLEQPTSLTVKQVLELIRRSYSSVHPIADETEAATTLFKQLLEVLVQSFSNVSTFKAEVQRHRRQSTGDVTDVDLAYTNFLIKMCEILRKQSTTEGVKIWNRPGNMG